MKKAWKKKEGSALLIAIVIMMIVMMLSTALLLVSYSLFATTIQQNVTEQCQALAQSISRELEEELTARDVMFRDSSQMKQALEEGKSPLWFYLRCNLWQENWPYYNEEESGHDRESAWRYFKIQADGEEAQEAVDGISVAICWESEHGIERVGDTSVIVQVTCSRGQESSTITSEYVLSIEATHASTEELLENSTCNPSGNVIDTGEQWIFSLSSRE